VVLCPLFCCLLGFLYFFCYKKRKDDAKEGGLLGNGVQAKAVDVTSSTAQAGADGEVALESIAVEPAEEDDVAQEHKAIKARLREYEIAYEAREGRKPRKRNEWGDMWPDYEKYAELRKKLAQPALGSNKLSTKNLLENAQS
jgi:hypothetical protein